MSFYGFIYHNEQVSAAGKEASEQLGLLFEAVTMGGEDTARSPGALESENGYANAVVGAFKGLKDIVVIDEERMKRGLEGSHLIGDRDGDSALNSKFMNSCLAFNTDYMLAGDCEDIYGAFTTIHDKELVLTFVSLDAIENERHNIDGAPLEDVLDAIEAAPAYMRELRTSIYTATQDASFRDHGARALLNADASHRFETCRVRVVGTDSETGKTIQTQDTVVTRAQAQARTHHRSAYVRNLHLGITN